MDTGTGIPAGSTDNFSFFYARELGQDGRNLCDGVRATCELDYNRLHAWFGDEPYVGPWNSIDVNIQVGSLGGTEDNDDMWLDAFDGKDVDLLRMLFVMELDEFFMYARGDWNPGDSNGEGLSRVLAFERYHPSSANAQGFLTVMRWLTTVGHFGNRPDWIDKVKPTDKDYVSTGCASLFLNWMRYDLHYGWRQIISAGGDGTLAQTYRRLTGKANGSYDFFVRTKDEAGGSSPPRPTYD
jgi:hypothetical protein